ncbi:MAG: DJ-1/PfpI family protein [Candidatus Bathyarchaeota archaeon]|nr:DJ-1/PfpI family protein [Candidatus Bathyarchaeota archaeon]
MKVEDYNAIICIGGNTGYVNLRKNATVLSMVKKAFASGKLVAAICAAPAVLTDAGILKGKKCTIYPGIESELERGG